MLSKSKYIALICGLTSIAITVAFYFLTFDSIFTIPMRWLSLMFLIFAETIGTVKAFCVKRNIFDVATLITSGIHIGVVLLISVVFMNIFSLLIKSYILVNVFALCVLGIVDVVILYFSNRVSTKNNRLNESQFVMRGCGEKAAALLAEFRESGYKKDLYEIVELLKYSDNSNFSQDEIAIMDKLDELKNLMNDNADGVSEKIVELRNLIKLRSLKVTNTKFGSY